MIKKKKTHAKHACQWIMPILPVINVAMNNNLCEQCPYEQCFPNLLVALLHSVKNLVSPSSISHMHY